MNKMDDRELRLNGLINSFDLNKSRYDDFEKSLNNLISRIVETSKVVVHDVTSRRKGRASFIDKIKKPGKAYTSLNEITDIVGIRITTYFESDVDIIKDIIEREFHIDVNNSIDKRKAHDPDRFG
ncbi:RelA/SpoT domain-containing protein, partial [Vibrio cholerae]|nr:RelA/SpoT domain-containing protein [Vibrio cholerae]